MVSGADGPAERFTREANKEADVPRFFVGGSEAAIDALLRFGGAISTRRQRTAAGGGEDGEVDGGEEELRGRGLLSVLVSERAAGLLSNETRGRNANGSLMRREGRRRRKRISNFGEEELANASHVEVTCTNSALLRKEHSYACLPSQLCGRNRASTPTDMDDIS